SVNAVLEMDALPGGTTSIVSQSGTMLGTLLSRGAARGLGFDKLVSVGNEAARSHTGALAGTDAALDAFFRDCGIVRVDMLETLLEIAPLVASRMPLTLKRAGRVSVVTTTGGGAASVVDRLGMRGVELAAPTLDLTMAASGQDYGSALAK